MADGTDTQAGQRTRADAPAAGQVARRGLAAVGAVGGAAALGLVGGGEDARAQGQPSAQPPLTIPRETLTLAAAQALLQAAFAKAQEVGVPMAVAVVDESGVLKAFGRMDGNSLASVALVQAKAFTSAAFRTPTHVLAERNQGDPTRVASLPNFPGVTFLGGGYPVAVGSTVVGGLGVGGGSAQQDQEVAEAALAAVTARP
jgi:uncharacterized protein GlcG (DUF336 family)